VDAISEDMDEEFLVDDKGGVVSTNTHVKHKGNQPASEDFEESVPSTLGISTETCEGQNSAAASLQTADSPPPKCPQSAGSSTKKNKKKKKRRRGAMGGLIPPKSTKAAFISFWAVS